MKTTLQLFTFILLCTTAKAQQNYFVYIQTDNKQPFYVKMNDKVLSSSASGYVVIPKLSTGSYGLTIGFPKEQWAQQTVPLVINKADAGYLLKNFGEKGWGLYNLQTMEVIMNGAPGTAKQTSTVENDDVFTNTLAGAANTDLSAAKKEKPPVAVNDVVQQPIVIADAVKEIKEINKIQKINSVNDVDGKSLIYVDKADTITIFIPVEAKTDAVKTIVIKKEDEENAVLKETKIVAVDVQNSNTNNSEKEIVVIIPADKPVQETIKPIEKIVVTSKPVVNLNPDCKSNADENDFYKIRKKMAASSTDDGMVSAAIKFFKTTCFSVDQIKNLSLLFLNDGGKYKFFDSSYPHITDTINFASLQSQLTDVYFVKRFKAMLHN